MSTRTLSRFVASAALLADAVAVYFVLTVAFAGTDPEVEMISAITVAALMAALAIAIHVPPGTYALIAAGGVALLGIALVAVATALMHVLSLGDLGNGGSYEGFYALAAGSAAVQVALFLAAWKARAVPMGDAFAASVVGALAVVAAATVAGFLVGTIASFFL